MARRARTDDINYLASRTKGESNSVRTPGRDLQLVALGRHEAMWLAVAFDRAISSLLKAPLGADEQRFNVATIPRR